MREIIFDASASCNIVSVSHLGVFKDAANYPLILILTKGKDIKRIKISYAFSEKEFLKEDFGGYEMSKEDLAYLPLKIIPINITQRQLNLVIKLLRESEKLSQYLKISEGFRIPQTLETLDNEKFELVKQYQFDRYTPIEEGSHISEDNLKEVVSTDSERYKNSLKEKIVIAEDALQITATIDEKNRIPQGGIYFGTLRSDALHLKYVISLLNSKLLSFVYQILFGGMHMGGGYLRYRTEFLKQLPIKILPKSQQQPFIDLVDKMLSLNKQFNEININFEHYVNLHPRTKDITLERYLQNLNLDASDKEVLNNVNKIEGKVTGFEIIEKGEWLVFKIEYEKEIKAKKKITKVEIRAFRCRIKDEKMRKFLYYSIKEFITPGKVGKGNLYERILKIKVPCFNLSWDKNVEIIRKIMEEYLPNVEKWEKLKKEIEETDREIDQKVYELYGLTEEEIKIVEGSKS